MDTTGLTHILEHTDNKLVVLSNDLMTKAIVNRSFPKLEVLLKSYTEEDVTISSGYGWWLSAAKLVSREYNEYGDEYIEEWKGVNWKRPNGDGYRSIFLSNYVDVLNKLKTFGWWNVFRIS